MVEACSEFGVAFLGDADSGVGAVESRVENTRGGAGVVDKTFEKLHVLEFDSTRKRMSVIVRDPATSRVLLVTKGAESSVLPRCVEGPVVETNRHIDEYALVGLRTLAVAVRELDDETYAAFSRDIAEAGQAIEDREKRISEVYNRLVDNNTSITICRFAP